MFFTHLPSYRPRAVFADLLEWHRQARLGRSQFVFQFTPEEFDLLGARAELAGVLACAAAEPGGQAARDALELRAAALVEGFRARLDSASDQHMFYCRQFIEVARTYGPDTTRTLMEYARARAAWETDPARPAVEEVESYADRLVTTTESILRMLDFSLPELDLSSDPQPAQ
jgi:hypothetical protein